MSKDLPQLKPLFREKVLLTILQATAILLLCVCCCTAKAEAASTIKSAVSIHPAKKTLRNHHDKIPATAISPNTLDKLGLAGSTPATGAYSLRLLSSAYTAPLVRVNINNSFYDVFADASTAGTFSLNSAVSASYTNYNDVQTGVTANTLGAMLGSDTVRVAIWYDQSGSGNDAVQADATKQPVIAVAGAINTSSGLPSMLFGGRYLRAVLPSLNPLTPHTLNSVAAAITGTIVTLSTTTAAYQNSSLGAGNFGHGGAWFGGWFEDVTYATGSPTTALSIRSKTYADTVIRGYFNGNYVFSMSPATGGLNAFPYNLTTPDIVIGLQNISNSTPLNGSASEVLVFTSLLNTADRQAVERNQSAYYSTAYTADAPPLPPVSHPLTLDKLGLNSSVTATGAYALRRLSSAYTGPLARITYSSGSMAPVYYDVYPDASAAGAFSLSSPISAAGSALDAAARPSTGATLNDIIAGGNFTVGLWNDQSGNNNNVLNGTYYLQPTIISSGAIVATPGGLPAITFQGRYLRAVLPSLTPATPHTLIGVASATQGNIVALSSAQVGYQNSCLGSSRGGQSAVWFGGYFEDNFYETGANTAALSIRSKIYTSADSTIRGYFNGSYVYAINPAIALNTITYNPYNLTTRDILLGFQNTTTVNSYTYGSNQPLNGSASEVLVFTSALNTAARQAVENSEATYYGIAYTADAPPVPTTPSPLTLDKAGLGSNIQATAAYSVRRLSSAYTGPLARVALPNNFGLAPTYYDVYPDAGTGAIASSSPIAFVGSAPDAAPHASTGSTLNDLIQTNATYRLERWYDQSGNGNHVLSYVQFNQPVLVTAGTLITNPSGSPAFSFPGTSTMRAVLLSLNPATAHTLNGVAAGTSGDILALSSTHQKDQNSTMGINNSGGNAAAVFGGWAYFNSNVGAPTTAAAVRTKVYAPGSINGYFNGANLFVSTATTYNLTTPDILVGSEVVGGGQNLNGTLSEAMVFTSALTDTDRKALEKNQANFYNILFTTKADTLVLAGATSPTNATTLSYTLSFENTVTGLTANNFSLSASSGITGANIGTPVTADGGLNWTIPVNTGSGDGKLALSLSNTQNLSTTLSNSLPLLADTVTIDKTAPVVNSIITANVSPTNATSVDYTVTFSEAVTGVDANDFTATQASGSVSGSVTGVTGSGTTYTVTVSSISGNGDLRLDLNASGTNIFDVPGNPVSGGFTIGQTYTIDTTPPTLTSGSYFSNNGFSSQYAKVGDNITLSIGYNEVLQSLVMTIGGNPVSVTPSNGNQNWTGVYTMTSADIEGNVPWTLSATDLAGNVRNYANTDFGTVLIFDLTPPTPVISAPLPATVGTNTGNTVSYNITYSDANFNFSTLSLSDITLNTTGTATGTIGLSGTGTSYVVTISNITGLGTLGISIGAGTAQDIPGNIATAPAPSATFAVLKSDATLASLTTSADPLSPTFDTNTLTGYTASVPNSVATMTVTPTVTDIDATVAVQVNGGGFNAVTSGNASAPLALNEGANTIDVRGTAQDGTTTKIYTLTVTRRAPAQLFSFVFNPGVTLHAVAGPQYKNYIGTVDNSVSSVTVTPKVKEVAATITVNNVTVASGATSGSIHLDEGENTITTIVTEGSISKTYSFVITRLPAASLLSLSVSPQTALKEVAGSNYKDYTASVVNSVSSVTITPAASEMVSVITVNNVQVISGTASGAINLNEGVNTITTVVTNGAVSRTYSIRITRQPPAQLFSLVFNPGITVHAVAGPAYKNYTGTVGNSFTSVTVTPKVQDPAATITVNNVNVASGTASGAITLNEGDNTIAAIVTQGSISHTYSFVITRAPSSVVMAYDPSKDAPVTSADIVVHQNVSPNGDGKSDGLVIEGIAAHPDNKLKIISRSGALVYEAKGYDNATKVFDGHGNNGKLQQAGTYFYSLEYKDGKETRHKTGFIVLKY